MGRTREFVKKIRDTKRTFHAKMGTIKHRSQLEKGSLTNVGKSTLNDNTTSSNSVNDTTNQTEKTKLSSKGNIGITSSAELLEKWRKVIINIDDLIINECSDLFMQVY